MPTVCIGSALDIFRSGKPPRAIFTNYPLGHSTGKPFDFEDQISIVKKALKSFDIDEKRDAINILDNTWGEKTWMKEAMSTEGVDTREARDETPQFQMESDFLAAKESGAI